MKKRWLFLLISLGLFLDIATKYSAKHFLTYGVPKHILGNFLRFTYVENSGVIFGIGTQILASYPILKHIILLLFAIFVLFFLIREYQKTDDHISKILYILILTGALGNVTERVFGYITYFGEWKLFYGHVVDFIDIGIGEFRWFFFNIADTFISVSVFLLLIRSFYLERKQKQAS